MMTQYDDGFVWFGLFGFVQVLVFVWFAWFDLDRLTNREFKFSTIQCGWVEELEIMIANYRDSADSDSELLHRHRDSTPYTTRSPSPRRGAHHDQRI